jgi:type IV secretory pathway VirB4 component
MATPSKATQEFVPVEEVRDGIIVLKNGGLRSILMASSLNFALKSQQEQESILFQFQNMLNSLDFSVQLFVQSRDLDIRPYISVLEERLGAQTDDLMRIQIREYMNFIKNFTDSTSIMSKSFFIVVPYNPPALTAQSGILGKITNPLTKKEPETEEGNFEEHRMQLQQRMAVVEQGLTRTGIRVVQLGTEEVIELLYKMFNPGELEKPMPIGQ